MIQFVGSLEHWKPKKKWTENEWKMPNNVMFDKKRRMDSQNMGQRLGDQTSKHDLPLINVRLRCDNKTVRCGGVTWRRWCVVRSRHWVPRRLWPLVCSFSSSFSSPDPVKKSVRKKPAHFVIQEFGVDLVEMGSVIELGLNGFMCDVVGWAIWYL